MKVLRRLLAFVAALCLCAGASAETITFIGTSTGAGTLGTASFSNAAFTLTSVSDTAAWVPDLNTGGLYWIEHATTQVEIAGLGVFDFVTPTRSFVYQPNNFFGWARSGVQTADFFYAPQSPQLGAWDRASSLGPISGTGRILQWNDPVNPIATSGGILSMLDAMPAATFEVVVGSAAAIPEPEAYAMLSLGLGLLGFLRRRKRSA